MYEYPFVTIWNEAKPQSSWIKLWEYSNYFRSLSSLKDLIGFVASNSLIKYFHFSAQLLWLVEYASVHMNELSFGPIRVPSVD